MFVKARVRKAGKNSERLVIELPASCRDNFKPREIVKIVKNIKRSS